MMNTNSMKQYEIDEAKKRMGTHNGNGGNTGMYHATSSNGMMNANLKGSEKMQAKEDMNHTKMY